MNHRKTFLFIILLVAALLTAVSLLVLPNISLAQGSPPCPEGTICNPFSGEGIGNSLIDFINFFLEKIVLPIGAVIAVLFLVLSGFLFVTARGDEEKLKLAKKTFLWTVVGIAVLLGSVVISTGIKNTICQIAPNTPLCD